MSKTNFTLRKPTTIFAPRFRDLLDISQKPICQIMILFCRLVAEAHRDGSVDASGDKTALPRG
jgi:hypothetical protein